MQYEFEQAAYAYGIQPAVCMLLGELVYQKLEESWRGGQRDGWSKAHQTLDPSGHPFPVGNAVPVAVPA